jgi:TolB-like protein
MRKARLRFITFLVSLLLLSVSLFAQKKESLAIFTFTGGNASDGEALASSLSRQATLRNAFIKTTLITRGTITAMNFEQRFQRNGLTDADTIFELGKLLNASHVIAGYITRLGNNNLILISIMDVESLQQIAGDYRTYRSIEEIDKLIPDIAQKLAGSVTRNTSGLPGLSVPPFSILTGVNQNDAMVLAQILACDLANGNTFAVLPRTDDIDKVREEHRRQQSGITNQERVKLLGVGRNAQYVLSGSVQRLGTLNKFTADILDIVDGSTIDGYEETYSDLSQGFELIPKLAAQLMWGVSLVEIKASSAGSYTITLTKDIQIYISIDFTGFENKFITIQGDLWGRSIIFTNNSSFSIPNNVVIILSNIELIGNSSVARGSVINVKQGGKLEMQNGSAIKDNLSMGAGGGVYVNGGTFIMNGGTISGNTASGWLGGAGGGVYIDGGTFIMNGGTIDSNKAFSPNGSGLGGGLCVISGNFSMNGGIIRNNEAFTSGGGICFFGDTFLLDGGNINNNKADISGGGVYLEGKTFIMKNGTINSNLTGGTSIGFGGGVCVYRGVFSMNGGIINGNYSKRDGGGVYVDRSTFFMNGGTISGNTAITNGGGVWAGEVFIMNNGTIRGNTAYIGGGGVYVPLQITNFTKYGGTISSTNSARDGKVVGGLVKRNSEAGTSVYLNNSIIGKRGGWE